jgi:hypothetical protein
MRKKDVSLICLIVIIVLFPCAPLFSANLLDQSIDSYLYNQTDLPSVYFFPQKNARWNGYGVLNSDWHLLDDNQKNHYIFEGLKEIREEEGAVLSVNEQDIPYIKGELDAFVHILALGGKKSPVIVSLFRLLNAGGKLSFPYGYKDPVGIAKQQIMSGSMRSEPEPEVLFNHIYTGYINCYKKYDAWLKDADPPAIGEIRKLVIFSRCQIFPSGKVILSHNYSWDLEYRIVSLKEINSFVDTQGLDTHYYKVRFEAVVKSLK